MSAKHSLVGTEIIRYLDDSRELIWDVEHDSFAVATHTQPLHTLLHCRGEAMFQNLPEVADMADLLVTVEMVCSEALCRRGGGGHVKVGGVGGRGEGEERERGEEGGEKESTRDESREAIKPDVLREVIVKKSPWLQICRQGQLLVHWWLPSRE